MKLSTDKRSCILGLPIWQIKKITLKDKEWKTKKSLRPYHGLVIEIPRQTISDFGEFKDQQQRK